MKVYVLRWEGNTDYTSGVSGVYTTREKAEKAQRDLEDGEIEDGNQPYGREDDWDDEDAGMDADWTIDYTIEELEVDE